MKKKVITVVTVSVFLTITAFKIADDIIDRLDMNATTAQNFILGNLTGDFNSQIESYPQQEDDLFRIPYSKKMLPAIIAGDKAGAAAELCSYIKSFCSSNEFIAEYNKRRVSALPLSDNGVTAGTLKHNIDIYLTNIKNYKTNEKYVAEQQELMAADQQRLNKLLEDAKQPFPQKKEWEETYPADPATLVKRRLQEYLALVATVDFTAKLTEPDKYKKQRFVNPVYEKKSLKWKAIYRAGKEVNDVVTVFVKEWLKGEIIPSQKINITTSVDKAKPAAALDNNKSEQLKTSNNNPASQKEPMPVKPLKEKKGLLNKIKVKAKEVRSVL